jgi:hypothetical protein
VNGSITNADAHGGVSAALVQKYLKVIDLTASGNDELVDQSAMLTAIADRLRGISRAFSGCGYSEQRTGQPDTSLILGLYTWSVT